MLEIQRTPQSKTDLSVRAVCGSCGDEIINISASKLAVRGFGRDTRLRLLHNDCVGFHRKIHSRGWTYVPASRLFDRLSN